MSEHITPRINSARMKQYKGKRVHLPCKILNFQGEYAEVEATDGGHVFVKLCHDANLSELYHEIIGTVIEDGGTLKLKMMAAINFGSNFDMALMDKVIGVTHDPRFAQRIFGIDPDP